MTSLAVVEDLDVLPDGGFSLGSGRVAAMMNQFILEASPEALHRRVIIAIASA